MNNRRSLFSFKNLSFLLRAGLFFLALLLLNALHVAIMPFCGGFSPYQTGVISFGLFVKSSLFYCSYWLFFICIVLDKSLSNKRDIFRFLASLALQAVLVCVRVSVSGAQPCLFFVLFNLTIPLQWVALFFLLSAPEKEMRKRLFILLAVSMLWLLWSLYADLSMVKQIAIAQRIWAADSQRLADPINNSLFRCQMRFAFSEAFFAGLLFVLLPKREPEERRVNKISRLVAQALLCALFVGLFYSACLILSPDGVIVSASLKRRNSIKDSGLTCSSRIMELRRFDMAAASEISVFQQTKCAVFFDEKSLMLLSADGSFPATTSSYKDNVTSLHDGFLCMSVGGKELGLFCEKEIVVADGNSYEVLPLSSLPETPRDDALLFLCRTLAEEHTMYAFPYFAQYLARWDSAFIAPYLKEYAEMRLATVHILADYKMRTDFVQNEAVTLLAQIAQ